jgi:hypothetical protein
MIVLERKDCNDRVLYWFEDLWSAERNHYVIKASENGVGLGKRLLSDIPEAWLKDAKEVHAELSKNREADVSRFITHVNSVVSNGPLVPINRES